MNDILATEYSFDPNHMLVFVINCVEVFISLLVFRNVMKLGLSCFICYLNNIFIASRSMNNLVMSCDIANSHTYCFPFISNINATSLLVFLQVIHCAAEVHVFAHYSNNLLCWKLKHGNLKTDWLLAAWN